MKWLLPFIDNEDVSDDGTTTLNPDLGQLLQRLASKFINIFDFLNISKYVINHACISILDLTLILSVTS